MKLLHTADWHLGQKFIYRERIEEHQAFLHWLLQVIQTQQIDILIVAGDIFDISSPPHYARTMYYRFLSGLLKTNCRHIVITGGNHDSPSMLNAPKELLSALNITVVGAVSDNPEDDILELKKPSGEVEGVIAAIPFLRDRDINFISAFESGEARLDQIKKGIIAHFEKMAALVAKYESQDIPVITTGHLYAKGGKASDNQNNIYLGNMDNIDPALIPDIFDYVALGHLHKAQPMGKLRHIRYSGSPIPLSFPESKDKKTVTVVDFKGKKPTEIKLLEIPLWRHLSIIEGDLVSVQEQIGQLTDQLLKDKAVLTAWIEVIVHTDHQIPGVENLLYEFVENKAVEILKFKVLLNNQNEEKIKLSGELSELSPLDVFKKRCEDMTDEDYQPVEQTYLELMTWMNENEDLEG